MEECKVYAQWDISVDHTKTQPKPLWVLNERVFNEIVILQLRFLSAEIYG
jgi:hypothetical protein